MSVKQECNKYHFLNLCYNSTWDWTPVSQAISDHSTHKHEQQNSEYKYVNTLLSYILSEARDVEVTVDENLLATKLQQHYEQFSDVVLRLQGLSLMDLFWNLCTNWSRRSVISKINQTHR